MSLKDLFQTIYYAVGTIAALGTFIAALLALFVYQKNSRLERARWASTLYEKFYHEDRLKQIRDALDGHIDSAEVNQLVSNEDPKFTDYLNFFEFIAFLRKSKQLEDSEIDDLFGYYLDCLKKDEGVRTYILNPDKGYEGVAKLIGERK